jgi:hypothetical protein
MTRSRPTLIAAILGGLMLSATCIPVYAGVCDDPQTLFPPPIPLGVSGGSLKDYTKHYCCSGTLGCLVEDQATGTQYILSNNHVLARVNKGKVKKNPDPIIQPGLIDSDPACSFGANIVVATLTAFIPLQFGTKVNTVDAALAQVVPGEVDPDGTIDCIGAVSSQLASPTPGLAVQKNGRTSGLTTGTVAAVNVSILVGYPQKCGSGKVKPARFSQQIRIDGNFAAGGDSGSLIVSRETCPRPVGLLFAGSDSPPQTFANPMDLVLAAFAPLNLEVVGACANAAPPEATPQQEAASRRLARLKDLQARHEDAVMAVPGVVGMGIGVAPDGSPRLEIYVKKKTPALMERLPRSLDGEAVQVVETGEVRAF